MQINNWKIQTDWGHLLLVTLLTGASIWYFFDARSASGSVYNLIMIAPCVAAIAVLYLITLVMEIRVHVDDSEHSEKAQSLRGLLEASSVRNVAMMTLLIVYVLVLELLGFEIATFFFIGLSLLLQGETRFAHVAAFSILFSIFATWLVSTLSLAPIPTTFM